VVVAIPVPETRRRVGLPGLPKPRRSIALIVLALALAVASATVGTLLHLRLPATTGPYPVGRTDTHLVDTSRIETEDRGAGHRALRVVAWYPAEAGTGAPATYVPGFDRIAPGLEASGELPGPVVAALRFVGTNARADAAVAGDAEAYPVILLSPGNATNVAFYGALAEDLASHGFVVLGVDHPFQSAAVDTGDRVAVYREDMALPPGVAIPRKIDERIADLTFLLERLAMDGAGLGDVGTHLDLDRIGIVGHSNGGITAAVMCADERIAACLNIDGQQAGGPFSPRPDPAAPAKPFLYLTKETTMGAPLLELFEAGGADTYRVMVPAADHDSFTDGPRLRPRILPLDGVADHVLVVERGVVGRFFERYLGDPRPSGPLFDEMDAPTDVYIEVYPLDGLPHLTPPG
jgi:predicted dienelactone hydrolase